MTDLARVHEDLGALKALTAAINAKLDEGNQEFRSIRSDQAALKTDIVGLKTASELRTESYQRIEEKLETVTKQVDQLVALRHRVAGAFFLLSLIGGGIYAAWDLIEQISSYILHLAK
jgi:chromosome segregation ATPase